MTPEEYKIANDLLYDTVRQRDAAEGRVVLWKCISGLLAFIILWDAGGKVGMALKVLCKHRHRLIVISYWMTGRRSSAGPSSLGRKRSRLLGRSTG